MITKDEIVACEAKLLQAMKACDLSVLDQLLHDDLLFNAPNGDTITKQMDLSVYRSGNMIVEENNSSDQQISLIGDTALVTVTIALKGQFMKQPIAGKFRYFRTWKKIGESWKMIGGACTPMP